MRHASAPAPRFACAAALLSVIGVAGSARAEAPGDRAVGDERRFFSIAAPRPADPATQPAATRPARRRVALELELGGGGVFAVEGTGYWAPAALVRAMVGARLALRSKLASSFSIGLGYEFFDASTTIDSDGLSARETLRHHVAVVRAEAVVLQRLHVGARLSFALVDETLHPGSEKPLHRSLIGLTAGPTLALRILGDADHGLRLMARYDLQFVIAPQDRDGAMGRAHTLGLSLAWSP